MINDKEREGKKIMNSGSDNSVALPDQKGNKNFGKSILKRYYKQLYPDSSNPNMNKEGFF